MSTGIRGVQAVLCFVMALCAILCCCSAPTAAGISYVSNTRSATKAVGGAAGSLSNSGRFEGLSMGMRGFCKGNKKCWLYTDYANDPDKVDADAEFNKYEASAIVTLAGKGIMYVNHPWYKLLWLNSIACAISGFAFVLAIILMQSARAEEMQGGAPNTTARYAFIGFLAMSLTINLGAFVYVANYFGKSKGALSYNSGLGAWGNAFYLSLVTWICAALAGACELGVRSDSYGGGGGYDDYY